MNLSDSNDSNVSYVNVSSTLDIDNAELNVDTNLDVDCLSTILTHLSEKDLPRYLTVSKWIYKKIRSTRTIIKNKHQFLYACESGKYLSLIWCTDIPIHDSIDGYHRACESGHLPLVKYLIPRSNHISYSDNRYYNPEDLEGIYNTSMYLASRKNYMEIVLFIDYIASTQDSKLNYDSGLYGACESKSLKLTEYMISKGAKDWNMGLLGACSSNSLHLVEFMVEKGAISLGIGLSIAKDQKIIDYLKNKLEGSQRPYNKLFYR